MTEKSDLSKKQKGPSGPDSEIKQIEPAGQRNGAGNNTKKARDLLPNPDQGNWVLEADKDDLITILNNVPCGLSVLNSPFGKALFINKELREVLGYNLFDVPTTAMLTKKGIPGLKKRKENHRFWKQAVMSGGHGPETDEWLCGDGNTRTFEHRSVVIRKNLIACTWQDVTRREAAEAELRQTEELFRSFFENSGDPFLLFDDERPIDCNDATLRLFGAKDMAQITEKSFGSLSSEKPPKKGKSNKNLSWLLKKARKLGHLRVEWSIRRADKKDVPVELSMCTVLLGSRRLFFMVLRDVTLWKEAQNVLLQKRSDLENAVRARTSELVSLNKELRNSREELRRLSEYLQQAREEERIRIAREVHDRLGHSLTGLKMNLTYYLKNRPEASGGQSAQAQTMIEQIDQAIHGVQDICSELRPTILNHFGLIETVKWYLQEFQTQTGIKCRATIVPDIPRLDGGLDILIFRILEEVMTNILRHSCATAVTVRLKRDDNSILLRVKDNGRGILRQEIIHPRSLGILGIRERVRFWGGRSEFKGTPNKGTTVSVLLPLKNGCGR